MRTEDFLEPNIPLFSRGKMVIKISIATCILILFLPWIAFTTGSGSVTALDPNERPQKLTAPVNGFVRTWYVKEGQFVKKGDLIAEISDNDPELLDRYEVEKDATRKGLASATLMRDTAKLNLDRQSKLLQEGLSSRRDYEKAKIELSKLEMNLAKAQVTLTKSESQFMKQKSQEIRSPRDGWIVRLFPAELGQLIKKGTVVAIFSPVVTTPAVEVWVDGNDVPMIQVGQTARIQFDGWPSLQIPGWPSVAVNTFAAKVHLVDQASSAKGKFRLLLTPAEPWPSNAILKLGLSSKGYIKLSNSYILREIWRKLNNFPAYQDPYLKELSGFKAEIEK